MYDPNILVVFFTFQDPRNTVLLRLNPIKVFLCLKKNIYISYAFASGKVSKITFLVAEDTSEVPGPSKLLQMNISPLPMVGSCLFCPIFSLNCQIIVLFQILEEKLPQGSCLRYNSSLNFCTINLKFGIYLFLSM